MGKYILIDTFEHKDFLTAFRFEIKALDGSDNSIEYMEDYVTNVHCSGSALTLSFIVEATNNSIEDAIELASKAHKITVLNKNEQDSVVSSVSYVIVGNCDWNYTLYSDNNEFLLLTVTYLATPHFNKV